MAKTKSSAKAARASAPSVSQLSDLARHFRQQKDTAPTEEPAAPMETSEEPVDTKEPSTSVPSTSKAPSKDVPERRARQKTKPAEAKKAKSKGKPAEPPTDPEDLQIYAEDLVSLKDFDRSELNFELCWGNFAKLKAFYALDDRETCTFLLGMCGATSEGKKYWEKFDVPLHLFDEDGTFNSANLLRPVEVTGGPKTSDVKVEGPKEKNVRSEVSQGPPQKVRKVAAAAPVAPTDVSMSDSESSEEEDLLSSSGSHPPPPPPQIPPTVARPEDLDVDCEDSPLDPPGLPEPVKIPTNHEVLHAKHALKESMKNVPTPTKANAAASGKSSAAKTPSRLQSCETLVLGAQELTKQASAVKPTAAPEDTLSELGPSASHLEADRSDQINRDHLLAALTALQNGFTDPDLRAIFRSLADQFCSKPASGSAELEAARKGQPASSKPHVQPEQTQNKPEKPQVAKPKEAKDGDNVVEPAKGEDEVKKGDGPHETTADEESDVESVKAEPAPPVVIINSSTHRKEHARLARRMAAADAAAACPEMYRLWSGSRKEKSDLLKQWIESGENLNACETQLVLTKSQETEVAKEKELLTIKDMVDRGFSQKKIDSIISKNQPVYDEDCPDCPESVRFWCFTAGRCTDREKVAVTGQASINVRSNAETVGSLVDASSLPSSSACGSAAPSGGLSLSSLVTVMKDCQEGDKNSSRDKKEATKEKSKKEKKEKKAKKEDPQTTKEKKESARKDIKKELNACSVIFDLPADNALRQQVAQMKTTLEDFVDKINSCTDETIDAVIEDASSEVDACKLLRAQARAVAAELRKTKEAK